jgi:hypothetical protein
MVSALLHFLIVTREFSVVTVFELVACLALVALDIGVRYLDAYYEPPSASEDGENVKLRVNCIELCANWIHYYKIFLSEILKLLFFQLLSVQCRWKQMHPSSQRHSSPG